MYEVEPFRSLAAVVRLERGLDGNPRCNLIVTIFLQAKSIADDVMTRETRHKEHVFTRRLQVTATDRFPAVQTNYISTFVLYPPTQKNVHEPQEHLINMHTHTRNCKKKKKQNPLIFHYI